MQSYTVCVWRRTEFALFHPMRASPALGWRLHACVFFSEVGLIPVKPKLHAFGPSRKSLALWPRLTQVWWTFHVGKRERPAIKREMFTDGKKTKKNRRKTEVFWRILPPFSFTVHLCCSPIFILKVCYLKGTCERRVRKKNNGPKTKVKRTTEVKKVQPHFFGFFTLIWSDSG